MQASEPRRARSMTEMGLIQGRMFRADKIGEGVSAYRPRSTDVVISPSGKCGTTWLQQTFHTLRTRGDMDFDDISRVVPWIETSQMLGLDLEAPQRAAPRGFKSHLSFDAMPKGARYVVSLRDPKDALVSMYHFMEGWFFEPGAITLSEFSRTWIDGLAGPNIWSHLTSWWTQRNNPDVLLLSYEHMVAEPELNVRRLAEFCGFDLDDDLLALTLERSSLSYMLAHKDRFDDAMIRQLSEATCNLPPGSDSAKVRKGTVGGHKAELEAEIADALEAIWTKEVASVTGYADYAALEKALRSL